MSDTRYQHRITYACKLNYTEHVVSKNYACIHVLKLTIWWIDFLEAFFKIQNCVKINGKTFFSLKLFPLIASGPQKPQKLTASKIKYESFRPKFLIPR